MQQPLEKRGGPSRYLNLLLTLVATVIAVITYFSARGPAKAIEVHLESSQSLLATDAAKFVTVTHGSERVTSPVRVVFSVLAKGREPIRRDDIESHVFVRFPQSRVLIATVAQTSPVGMSATVSLDQRGVDQVVSVAHGLLNPGDYIRVEVLVDGAVEQVSVGGRIAGVATVYLRDLSVGEKTPFAEVRPFLIAMPAGIEWALLILCTMAILSLGIVFFRHTIKGVAPNEKRVENRAFGIIDVQQMLADILQRTDDLGVRAAIGSIPPDAGLRAISSFEEFCSVLRSTGVDGVELHELSEKSFAVIQQHLPAVLGARIARDSICRASEKMQSALRDAEDVPVGQRRLKELVLDVFAEAKTVLLFAGMGRMKPAELFGYFIGITLLCLIFLPFILIIANAWRQLIWR